MPKRRGKGDGGVYQACDDRYGCPPTEKVTGPDGKTRPVRPDHKCRGPWCAALELGYRNGKRQRKVLKARTKSAVVDKLDEARKQLAATGTVPTKIPTLAQWLRFWLDEIEVRRVVPTVHRGYRTHIETHIIPNIGKYRIDQLTPAHVLRLHNILRDTDSRRNKGEKIAEGSILRVHTILSTALEDAHRMGYATRNVAKLVDRPGKGNTVIEELDAEQAARLLERVVKMPGGSRWAFSLLTGQRQGEIIGLRWDYVDLDEHVIDVSWQLQRIAYRHGCLDAVGNPTCGAKRVVSCPSKELDIRRDDYEYERLDGGLCLVRPKREKRRVVPIIPILAAWLEHHRDEATRPSPHGLVWTRDGGRPLSPRRDRADWYTLLDECGLPRVRPHSARHSVVSLLYSLGTAEVVTQQIVGHSNVATTRGYKNQDLRQARLALEQLGDHLKLSQHLKLGQLPPAHVEEIVNVEPG